MRGKSLLLYGFITASIIGCSGMNEQAKTIDRLSRQVSELRYNLDDTKTRLDDLNNKFTLLHEKVEASKTDIQKLTVFPETPPEGLRIVSLNEAEEHKKTEEAKKKKVEKPQIVPAAVVSAPPLTEAPVQTEKAGADALYNKGQDFFLAGKYAEARKVFANLVKTYPAHNLSDNALYWIGESYYSEKDFEKAIMKFKEVADKYPDENKAPDALLKAGLSYMEMENFERARESFERLIKRYPDSEAADKAAKTLSKLSGAKKEGSNEKN